MKKLLFIAILLVGILGYSQAKSKYQRLGKLTQTEIDNIDVSDASVVYTAYNTTTGREEINTGSGWVARVTGGGGPESDPIYSADPAFDITAQHITDLDNLSGTNSGDQDLSGYFKSDGSFPATGDFDMDEYDIRNIDTLNINHLVGAAYIESLILKAHLAVELEPSTSVPAGLMGRFYFDETSETIKVHDGTSYKSLAYQEGLGGSGYVYNTGINNLPSSSFKLSREIPDATFTGTKSSLTLSDTESTLVYEALKLRLEKYKAFIEVYDADTADDAEYFQFDRSYNSDDDVARKKDVDAAIAGGGGLTDTSLSDTDQTIPDGTTRIINTDGSTGAISFQQDGNEIMKLGGNNDLALYVNSLEALEGGNSVITSTSPIKVYMGSVGLTDPIVYEGTFLYDDNILYFSDGTQWIDLSSISEFNPADISIADKSLTNIDFDKYNYSDKSRVFTLDNSIDIGSRGAFRSTDIDSTIAIIPDTGVGILVGGTGITSEPVQIDSCYTMTIYKIADNLYGIDGPVKPYDNGPSLGPELIVNGNFDTDTSWTKNGGSTISGGVGNIIGQGNLNVTGSNSSLYQDTTDNPGVSASYLMTFDARQVTGTGNFLAGRLLAATFNQQITGTMKTYSVVIPSSSSDQNDKPAFGGLTPGDTFEVDNVSFKRILD